MPKKGEKARKLAALSHGKGVKPPKKWWDIVKRSASKQYPGFGQKRLGQVVGGIWSRMSTASKKKIVIKYQR